MTVTELLDEYLAECRAVGGVFERAPGATEEQWEAVCGQLGVATGDIPQELIDWFAWSNGIGDWENNMFSFLQFFPTKLAVADWDIWIGWEEFSPEFRDSGDPGENAAVDLLIAEKAAHVVVSVRPSDAGSVWLRNATTATFGKLWDSIPEMLECMIEIVRGGYLIPHEHKVFHMRFVNPDGGRIEVPDLFRETFYLP